MEKLGKEVRSPETEDQLEFLVDISAGNDDGLVGGVFTHLQRSRCGIEVWSVTVTAGHSSTLK